MMDVMFGSTPTKGRLLIATPPLEDPNFDRTVIYVLEHHDEGALGLVLNRPSLEELGDALQPWSAMQSDPSLVFVGGPVEPDALIAIARVREPLAELAEDEDEDDRHLAPLSGDLASADLAADPLDVAGSISELRVFRGYAGWGPGQLDGEIEAGAWLVLDPEPGDLFTDSPDDLWRVVLRRQPGRLAWLASAPDDLSAN
jgi:putative transcriptional regulator